MLHKNNQENYVKSWLVLSFNLGVSYSKVITCAFDSGSGTSCSFCYNCIELADSFIVIIVGPNNFIKTKWFMALSLHLVMSEAIRI